MEKIPTKETLAKLITVTVLNKAGNKIDEFQMRGGTNLWVFIRKRGLPIGSACSGVGVCGACHLKVTEITPQSISIQNEFEKETLIKNQKPTDERLACLCRISGDIIIQADYW
ncbi:2Fe-2S iron-sulfur cluster-binding protein [Fluviispira multicolorata]|nr:2Fe-2S iron-sulfur cluster-binding protein [Fluviispira multicolorata]